MERLKTADTGRIVTLALLLAGAIFLLVGCLSSTQFATYTVQGVANGMVYGVLGLALVLIYQATHVINFAQGELAMLTTYIAYQLIQWGLTYWEAFFVTLVIAFVLGIAVQLTIIRPVQHRSVIATVIVTVGLFIFIDGVVNWIWGGEFKTIPAPFGYGSSDPRRRLDPASLHRDGRRRPREPRLRSGGCSGSRRSGSRCGPQRCDPHQRRSPAFASTRCSRSAGGLRQSSVPWPA